MSTVSTFNRNMAQPLVAAGALIEQGTRYLLVKEVQKHIPNHPDHGKWNIPAGMIDIGESPEETVVREVKEETGYVFTPQNVLGIYSTVRHRFISVYGHPIEVIRIIYLGSVSEQQGQTDNDVSETRWFTAEEINAMDNQTLRDSDIKDMIRFFKKGVCFPLDILHHSIQSV